MVARTKAVGSRELKTRLGGYLRAVRQGLVIVVTERGTPVAELRPLDPSRRGEQAGLADLERSGVLTRASGKPIENFEPIRVPGRAMSELVSDEREDRVR